MTTSNQPGEAAYEAEPPIPDDGFSRVTMRRIMQYRERRRRALSLAGSIAAAISAGVALTVSPALGAWGEPSTLAALLMVSALIGLCWVSTESPLSAFE